MKKKHKNRAAACGCQKTHHRISVGKSHGGTRCYGAFRNRRGTMQGGLRRSKGCK